MLFLVFLSLSTFVASLTAGGPQHTEMNREWKWCFFLPGLTAPSDNLLVLVFYLCCSSLPQSLQGCLCGCASDILAALGPSPCWRRGGMSHHEKRYVRIETILVWVFQYHFCTTIVWSKYSDLRNLPGFWTP